MGLVGQGINRDPDAGLSMKVTVRPQNDFQPDGEVYGSLTEPCCVISKLQYIRHNNKPSRHNLHFQTAGQKRTCSTTTFAADNLISTTNISRFVST